MYKRQLYGFRDINYEVPYQFDRVRVPGGTDLYSLASYLGVAPSYLKELNPSLVMGFVPTNVSFFHINIPKGASKMVALYSEALTSKTRL